MSAMIDKLRKHGVRGSAAIVSRRLTTGLRRRFDVWRFRNEPRYANSTNGELVRIENDLRALSIEINDYTPP